MRHYSIAMVAACPFPANYGTPGAIREMSQTLADKGHDVHIVTYPFGESLPVGKAKLWRAPFWRKRAAVYTGPSLEKLLLDCLLLIKLCEVIRTQKISIIHAHNYEGALIGFAAKILTGRPLLYNAVNLMGDELQTYNFLRPKCLARGLARLLDWLVVRIPDHFIAITSQLRDEFLRRGIARERIALVPCGIKLDMFAHADPVGFSRAHALGERPVVMYTGVTSPFQRLDNLFKAFRTVLDAEPEAMLMIVSPLTEDPDMPASKMLAASAGISEKVIWVQGHKLDELPDYLALASVAVVPRPHVPGHPIKLLNYMAAGCPIVCFEGAAKGVQHMKDAYVVPDDDVSAMSQGIIDLLRDRQLAKRLGASAKETVARDFDWESLCIVVEGVYRGMLDHQVDKVETPVVEPCAVATQQVPVTQQKRHSDSAF